MVICRQLARLPTCSIKIDLFVSEISSVSSCEESTTHFSIYPYLTMTVNNKDNLNSLTDLSNVLISDVLLTVSNESHPLVFGTSAGRSLTRIWLSVSQAR